MSEDREEAERAELELERAQDELAELNDAETFKELLKAEAFRDFLWKLIERCAVYSEAWNPNFGATSYSLGKMAIGKWLILEINRSNPDAWVEMQRKDAKKSSDKSRQEKQKRRKH